MKLLVINVAQSTCFNFCLVRVAEQLVETSACIYLKWVAAFSVQSAMLLRAGGAQQF